jgi:hypothetical protein
MNAFIDLVYSLAVTSSLISVAEQARLQQQVAASPRLAAVESLL